jgi:hypothetical protein
VRNQLWLLRGSSFTGLDRARYARSGAKAVATYVSRSPDKGRALRTVAQGIREGLGREPD